MVDRATPEDLEAIAAAVRPGARAGCMSCPELDDIARPTTGEVAPAMGLGRWLASPDLERDVAR